MIRLPGGGIFEPSTGREITGKKASRRIRCTKAQRKGSLGTESSALEGEDRAKEQVELVITNPTLHHR